MRSSLVPITSQLVDPSLPKPYPSVIPSELTGRGSTKSSVEEDGSIVSWPPTLQKHDSQSFSDWITDRLFADEICSQLSPDYPEGGCSRDSSGRVSHTAGKWEVETGYQDTQEDLLSSWTIFLEAQADWTKVDGGAGPADVLDDIDGVEGFSTGKHINRGTSRQPFIVKPTDVLPLGEIEKSTPVAECITNGIIWNNHASVGDFGTKQFIMDNVASNEPMHSSSLEAEIRVNSGERLSLDELICGTLAEVGAYATSSPAIEVVSSRTNVPLASRSLLPPEQDDSSASRCKISGAVASRESGDNCQYPIGATADGLSPSRSVDAGEIGRNVAATPVAEQEITSCRKATNVAQ
ncbi:hypothetical protein BV25DRAFT_1912437 [Artomyces pyxidatus]|uniref:Uncharacterized protein n=1 Tax=Artomyces pyxidatus TaxID=48021 RepID=A0ACB8TFB5_9AGAM|nr:hypothetical protein BV25DRAFT_1912437 [Artomyces pyxidatus]